GMAPRDQRIGDPERARRTLADEDTRRLRSLERERRSRVGPLEDHENVAGGGPFGRVDAGHEGGRAVLSPNRIARIHSGRAYHAPRRSKKREPRQPARATAIVMTLPLPFLSVGFALAALVSL